MYIYIYIYIYIIYTYIYIYIYMCVCVCVFIKNLSRHYNDFHLFYMQMLCYYPLLYFLSPLKIRNYLGNYKN